ncbi:DUF5038 domain-containing protein [Lachnoclostridium sp. An118]|uniref:DUF5038 domain-containing protein n=1 Tax=Lachnoclostridium sp. An118 TaxID=1965547 RepID=UPI0013A607D8|nr:DUF5038 domain-containing protein [Lachnoclostridium sp. An118]
MSRIKLILSILLMLFLLAVGIFLPSRLRERKEPPKQGKETVSAEKEAKQNELTEMDFLSFEELSQFFSFAQTASLKEQFPVYLTHAGRSDITSAEYLPDETAYPDTITVELHFLLSDDSTLPVFYDTMTGTFSFGEEREVLGASGQTYEKPVVDTLPPVSASEVEQRQEGGYADVAAPEKETPQAETDAPAESSTQEEGTASAAEPQTREEVQP